MYEALRKYRRLIVNSITAVGGALAIALIIYAAYYNTRFYPNTIIEGVDCSGLTVPQTEELLNARLMSRRVEIVSPDNEPLLSLTLGDIYSDTVPLKQRLDEMMAAQHGNFFGLFSDGGYEYSLQWPSAQMLAPVVADAAEGKSVAAVDAAIVETAGGWMITGSTYGSQPNSAACAVALADALSAGGNGADSAVMCVTLGDTAVAPAVHEDDPQLARHISKIDDALDIEVTVDFGAGLVHTFSYEQIRPLYDITVNGDGVEVTYVPERLRPVVDAVIETLGADGVRRKYGVIDREEFYYDESWDKGYVLYREELYSQLDALFSAGKSGTVTARYDYTGCLAAHYDHEWIEDTYIEISIDNQHMWYYVDGELLVETPVVTGCVTSGDDTRKGVFYVKYLDERAFLSGGSTNRGGGYWVDYWMPFDGNIGLHDAQWVTEFGGDIYLEDGSHGCVNTPLEAMAAIFNNTERFCTVVVH